MDKKVYLIDDDKISEEENNYLLDIDDKEWKKISRRQGNVYTFGDFVYNYNWDKISTKNSYIRIL